MHTPRLLLLLLPPVCRDTVPSRRSESLQTPSLLGSFLFLLASFAAVSRSVSRGSGPGPISTGFRQCSELLGADSTYLPNKVHVCIDERQEDQETNHNGRMSNTFIDRPEKKKKKKRKEEQQGGK